MLVTKPPLARRQKGYHDWTIKKRDSGAWYGQKGHHTLGRGLRRWLGQVYHPGPDRQSTVPHHRRAYLRGATGSWKTGELVDSLLSEFVEHGSMTPPPGSRGGRMVKLALQYAQAGVDTLRAHGYQPVGTQMPIVDPRHGWVTATDLVCRSPLVPSELVLVEVKTHSTRGLHAAFGQTLDHIHPPAKDTKMNRSWLQAMHTIAAARRMYHDISPRVMILLINEKGAKLLSSPPPELAQSPLLRAE